MLRSEAEKLCGLGSITDAGEHVARAQQGGLLARRGCRVHRVAKDVTPIVEIAGSHHRGHHADVGTDARDDEVLDLEAAGASPR